MVLHAIAGPHYMLNSNQIEKSQSYCGLLQMLDLTRSLIRNSIKQHSNDLAKDIMV